MAADTKRGAVLRPLDIKTRNAIDVLRNPPTLNTKGGAVWVTVDAKHNGVMVTLDSLREQLAAQGLHVVTAADKAVLDACEEAVTRVAHMGTEVLQLTQGSQQRIAEAITARREAAK